MLADRTPTELALLLDGIQCTPPTQHTPAALSALDEATYAVSQQSPELAEAHTAFGQARYAFHRAVIDDVEVVGTWAAVVGAAGRLAALLRTA